MNKKGEYMKNDFILSPSLLSADFSNLEKSIRQVEKKTKWLHLDVMDGHFVPNLTFGYPLIKAIRKTTDILFDAHLMVTNPSDFVEFFAEAGVNAFTFHVESCVHVDRLVASIHEANMKAGIALVPTTPLSAITEILPLVDLVLVMTVNPGFSGQKFIPYCVEKIKKLAIAKKEKGYNYYVSVDGGINNHTLPIVLEAGADVVVSGSSFFSGELNI